jgi:sucrose-6-phosphate hydrolase SacC (GH32 family)
MQYACGFESGKAPMADVRQQRSQYNGDRHRPGYHFISPEHWMNEPHAPLYFKGMYHIFFQHNPKGPYFGNIHWGHAVSTDMVHWKDLPFALSPQYGQTDPDGCWSGSSVIDDSGIPTLFYTAGDFGKMPNQMIAAAKSIFAFDKDINLEEWVKQGQQVITQKEGQGYYGEFRDPFVWKEGGTWYMLVGSGVPGSGGTALLYTSDDLVSWEYRKPVFVGNFGKYPKTGKVWELPVLLKLGTDREGNDKHIFIINPCYLEPSPYGSRYVFYWIGTWSTENLEFVPDSEQPQMFDYGDHFTGPSGMVDEKGRNIIFSIAQDRRTEKQHHDSGWAHNAGLPLMLYLREDGRLGIEPVPELLALRKEKLVSFENKKVNDANKLLDSIKGDMLEIILEFDKCCAAEYGIALRCTPDGTEETLILFNEETSTLYADRTKSSFDCDVENDIKGGPLDIGGENLKLHIYIDKSMIEVYANGLKSITTRAYPVSDAANGLKIAGPENTLVKNMEVWRLNSAYEE